VGPDAEEIRIGQGGVARERAPEDESVRQMLKHSAKGGAWRGKCEDFPFLCFWKQALGPLLLKSKTCGRAHAVMGSREKGEGNGLVAHAHQLLPGFVFDAAASCGGPSFWVSPRGVLASGVPG